MTPAPLCGLGEAGGEHRSIWCPATHLAWRRLCPSVGQLSFILTSTSVARRLAGLLLQQSVFLHSSLLGRAFFNPSEGANRILGAVRQAGWSQIVKEIGPSDVDSALSSTGETPSPPTLPIAKTII